MRLWREAEEGGQQGRRGEMPRKNPPDLSSSVQSCFLVRTASPRRKSHLPGSRERPRDKVLPNELQAEVSRGSSVSALGNVGRSPSSCPPAARNTEDGVAADLLDHEVTWKSEAAGSLGPQSNLQL